MANWCEMCRMEHEAGDVSDFEAALLNWYARWPGGSSMRDALTYLTPTSRVTQAMYRNGVLRRGPSQDTAQYDAQFLAECGIASEVEG